MEPFRSPYPSWRSVPCAGFCLALCCLYVILLAASHRSLYDVNLKDKSECTHKHNCWMTCGPKDYLMTNGPLRSQPINYLSANCSRMGYERGSNDFDWSVMNEKQCHRVYVMGKTWTTFCILCLFFGVIGICIPMCFRSNGESTISRHRFMATMSLFASGLFAVVAVAVVVTGGYDRDNFCRRHGQVDDSVWTILPFGWMLMVCAFMVSRWGRSRRSDQERPSDRRLTGYHRTGSHMAIDLTATMPFSSVSDDSDAKESTHSILQRVPPSPFQGGGEWKDDHQLELGSGDDEVASPIEMA